MISLGWSSAPQIPLPQPAIASAKSPPNFQTNTLPPIDHLAVVDSGNGGQSGLPTVVNQIGTLAPALFESIKATTGVDLASVIADKTDG